MKNDQSRLVRIDAGPMKNPVPGKPRRPISGDAAFRTVTAFEGNGGRAEAGVLHEGEGRAHAVIRAGAAGETHGAAVAATVGKSHDRIGRAEIEAKCPLLRHRHILVADRDIRPALGRPGVKIRDALGTPMSEEGG